MVWGVFVKKEQYIPQNPMFSGQSLRKLIIPLIIEQLLAVMVGLFDSIMVSSVGEAAVSGVSLVDTINILLICIMSSFATGGTVVVSQYIGAQRKDKANESASQLIFTVLACAVLLMVFVLAFKTQIMNLVFRDIEKDVFDNALIYMIYSAVSYPFLAVYNACAALFRSQGNSKVSMLTSLLMNVINIVGNAILIYGLQMGVEGASIATLASRVAGAFVMICLISSSKNLIYVDFKKKFIPDFHIIKQIMRIGIPNGFENSFFQLGKILVMGLVTTFGTVQITANAVGNSVASIATLPGSALGLAMITVVGQCVGAKDDKQALYYVKKLMFYAHMVLFLMSTIIAASLPFILNLYSLSEETKYYASVIIYLHSIFAVIIWPPSFTLPNALRAANDVKFTMYIALGSMVVFRIVFSYILGMGLGLGVIGVWIAMIIDWLCRSIFFVSRIATGRWKKYMRLDAPEGEL